MPITLGANIASLGAQRQLARSSEQLGSVFERLSSGQRINRASDDAAGLAIADSLNTDQRVYAQGVRNLNDGLSVLNIADGALGELSGIVTRLAELAEQSANGTLGNQQREALNEEAQALSNEYLRIVQSTEYNSRRVLAADFGELHLQAGYGLDGSIGDGLGGATGTGAFGDATSIQSAVVPQSIESYDVDGDGNQDAIVRNAFSTSILFGTGDGSFDRTITLDTTISANSAISVADINQDGNLDIAQTTDTTFSLFYGNGDGTFQSAITSTMSVNGAESALGDYNGDGNRDVFVANGADNQALYTISGDGTLSNEITFVNAAGRNHAFQDLDGDGLDDIIRVGVGLVYGQSHGDGTFNLSSINGGDNFSDLEILDFNEDGNLDVLAINTSDDSLEIYFGNGDGTFQSEEVLATGLDGASGELTTGDLNGDGFVDVVNTGGTGSSSFVYFGDGEGGLTRQSTSATSQESISLADYNNDGVLDIVAGSLDLTIQLAETTDGVSALLEFDLSSQAGSRQALPQFQQAIERLAEQRGQLGAFMARVGTAENVLSVTVENYAAAESRIRDADIATEAADLARLNILQQAGAAVLSQANIQPQLALQLL